MLRFAFVAVAAIGLFFVASSSAEAARRGGCSCSSGGYQTAAVVDSTQQAVVPSGLRSYSYEPGAPMYRTYRAAPRLNAWEYPKSDARRYSGGGR